MTQENQRPTGEDDAFPSLGQAGVDPNSIPLEQINVADPELFETDTHWG